MSWAVGYDDKWKRDIGYGVPAFCDFPGCGEEIDRGLAYVCIGQQPYGGEHGCGLFFCEKHRGHRCGKSHRDLTPTPDHPDWIRHKLTDPSWQRWRDENPRQVESMKAAQQGGEVSDG